MDGVEADDVISILVNSSELEDYKYKFIMSSDKDYLQLVSENIQVYNPTKKIMYSPKKVVEEFGIIPENFVYYKSFIGDRSDNIPSFGSIGEKNIIKFFPEIRNTKIEDLDFFYTRAKDLISEGKKYKGLDNLISDFDKLELNYKLIQLQNVDVSYHTKSAIRRILQEFVPSSYDYEFRQMFSFDGLYSRIENFDSWHRNFVNRLKS
jgi:DNA polymerase-1